MCSLTYDLARWRKRFGASLLTVGGRRFLAGIGGVELVMSGGRRDGGDVEENGWNKLKAQTQFLF